MHPRSFRRRPLRALPLVVALALAPLAAVPRDAEEPDPASVVATVKTLGGPVNVERAGATTPVAVGMGLLQGDVVVTGSASSVGMTFRDGALLSLGPDSRLLIERFRYAPATQEGQFDATLSRGRMAVVSGRIARSQVDAMKVRTPTALLGVRGTEFLVDAGP